MEKNYSKKDSPQKASSHDNRTGSNRDDSSGNFDKRSYSKFTKEKRTTPSTGKEFPRKEHGSDQRPARKVEYGAKREFPGADSERRSFNPNFSKENKPMFSKEGGERKPYNSGGSARPDSRKPFNRDSKPFDKDRKPFDRDAKPADGENRPFNRDTRKPFNRDSKPFDKDRKPFDRDAKPADGENRPFNRDTRKPFNRDSKPFDKDRKPFGRDAKPADGESRPFNRDSRKPFDRDSKPYRKDAYSRTGTRPRTKDGYNNENYPRFAAAPSDKPVRLNRYIANSGICSRREADDFIQAGVVKVNGNVVIEMGAKVMPSDEVRFNDSVIQGEKKVYIVMNKPKGYVTSVEDPHADRVVMELLKESCKERVYPVGRLDKNSMGVLLITNDGDLTKRLTHPSYEKRKVYQVALDIPLTKGDMVKLSEGITLEDGDIAVDNIDYVDESKREIGVEIHSGRNRIVRRMFESLGYKVQKLDRVYFAGLTKKNLKRGEWRYLNPAEVAILKSGRYE